jgi:hypothetical protein
MTMAYFASFDARTLPASIFLTLTKSGGGTISIEPRTLTGSNAYGTTTPFFNYLLANSWYGFDLAGTPLLRGLSDITFYEAVMLALRVAAADAGWPSPETLDVRFNAATRRVSFVYPTGLTAITFSALNRMFGFTGNWSGSATTVTGTQLPYYVIEPTLDGASSASVVFERDPVSALAFSANGRCFSVSRTVAPLYRTWVQQFETRAKVFQRFNPGQPNEYTYQDLFEDCRTRLPFAVYQGFSDAPYSAYSFTTDNDAFHPVPAVPGTSDQFHIPFDTIALARVTGLTVGDNDILTFDGEELFF